MSVEEHPPSLKKSLHLFFKKNKFLCLSLFALFLLVAFASMFRPIIIGYMFHHAYPLQNKLKIADYVYVLILMNGCLILFIGLRGVIYSHIEVKILSYLQTMVMKKIFQLPVHFFDRYTTGEWVHRVLWMVPLIQLFGIHHLGLIFSFLSLFLSFGLMFYFNWQLTLVVCLLFFVFSFFAIWYAVRLLPHLEEHAKGIDQAYGFLFQVLNGISRIKHFAIQEHVESAWVSMYVRSRHNLQNTYQRGVLGYAIFNSLPLLFLLIIFALSAIQRQTIIPYEFVIFFCGLCLLIMSIVPFYISAGSLVDALIAYRRIQPILSAESEKTTDLPMQMAEPIQQILLKDIYFSYPNSNHSILRGLNCQIHGGQHVAFVGLSGSGKSTLIKLLLGFYLPQKGSVQINGKSLHEVEVSTFRAGIGVVLQDAQLMNGTILENIIGHSNASEQAAWNILSDLGLRPIFASLPMGIHTTVSQSINLLSGGQKQLLLIARALVSDPQLLILDEATNFLDNKIQEIITQRINQLGKTRITIAHRLSTIKQVDNIFVLDQGKIIESGIYTELIDKGGLFCKLVESHE